MILSLYNKTNILISNINYLHDLIKKAGSPGAFLMALSVVSFITYRVRDFQMYASIDIFALISLSFIIICFIYSFSYYLKNQYQINQILFAKPIVFLSLYFAFCLLSSIWSSNAIYSGYRAFECITLLLLAVILFYHLKNTASQQDMVEWIIFWAIWHLMWSFLANIKLFGTTYLSPQHLFRTGALTLGMMVFLAIFISKNYIFSAIIIIFSLLSGANKTYIGFAAGIFPALFFGDKKAGKILFFFSSVVILILLIGGTAVLQNTIFYGQGGIGLDYMTGRSYMWTVAIEKAMEKPFWGYGFASAEIDLLIEKTGGGISSHNAFVSSFISVGILGPILLGLFYLNLFNCVVASKLSPRWKSALLGTVIMSLAISSSAPGLGGRVYGSWNAAILTSVLISVLTLSDRNSISCKSTPLW